MHARPLALTALIAVLVVGSALAEERKERRPAKQSAKADFKLPDSVKIVPDLVYAQYGERKVLLDLYLPNSPAQKALPCIMVIHGGGWRNGDKQRFAPIAASLADHGFAAACIGYRLLPEVEFPAPIQDCKAAVRWVRANADKYGIDGAKIGAIGGSAGAHLAAMLGVSHKVAALEGAGGNQGVSSRIQAVIPMAGPSSMTRYAERMSISKELADLISPLTHVDADSAPMLIMHGEDDRTVPMEQSEMLQQKLQRAGVPAEVVRVAKGPHGFWNQKPWFDDTMSRAVKFFNATLQGGPSESRSAGGHRP